MARAAARTPLGLLSMMRRRATTRAQETIRRRRSPTRATAQATPKQAIGPMAGRLSVRPSAPAAATRRASAGRATRRRSAERPARRASTARRRSARSPPPGAVPRREHAVVRWADCSGAIEEDMKTRPRMAAAPRLGLAVGLVAGLAACANVWGFDDLTTASPTSEASPIATKDGGDDVDRRQRAGGGVGHRRRIRRDPRRRSGCGPRRQRARRGGRRPVEGRLFRRGCR